MSNNIIDLDEKIKWTIGGVDYMLTKPTIGQVADFSGEFSGGTPKEQVEKTVSLLEKCGLPKEICHKLNADQLSRVVASLVPEKKG